MKTIQIVDQLKNALSITIVVVFVFLVQSCSQKVNFLVSPVVPAAEGSVKLNKDANNNYAIELRVMRLADPERLAPPKVVYIVWMDTPQNGVQNIGQLKLSKSLTSSLSTVSSYKPSRIFITAEDNATIQYPGKTVLETGVF